MPKVSHRAVGPTGRRLKCAKVPKVGKHLRGSDGVLGEYLMQGHLR